MRDKLRILLLEECNRSCDGCCNKDFDLNNLPVVDMDDLERYYEIILTGGEPMLRPELVLETALELKTKSDANIYMYTADVSNIPAMFGIMNTIDGITVTIHNSEQMEIDVENFMKFDQSLCNLSEYGRWPTIAQHCSLRLNVFKDVPINTKWTKCLWAVKNNINWIKNCPLPDGEVFMRLG